MFYSGATWCILICLITGPIIIITMSMPMMNVRNAKPCVTRVSVKLEVKSEIRQALHLVNIWHNLEWLSFLIISHNGGGGGGGGPWPSGLERWLGLAIGQFPGRVRIPLRQLRFGTLAIPFTPLCHCLSEESLKAIDWSSQNVDF